MKKQLVLLVSLTVLLAATAGAFLLLQEKEGAAESSSASAAEETFVLGASPKRFVKKVSVSNQIDTFTAVNGAQNEAEEQQESPPLLSVEGLDTATLNQTALRSLLDAVGSLPAKKTVSEGGADLALYGLAAPRATVTVDFGDQSLTLLVGDDAPGGEGVYVTTNSAAARVFLVESSKTTALLGSRLDFVSKTITPGNNQSSQFEKITLSGALYEEPIILEKAPSAQEGAPSSDYVLTAPIQSGADAAGAISQLRALFGLPAVKAAAQADFAGDAAAVYGLDAPYLRAEVVPAQDAASAQGEAAPAPFTVIFSRPDDAGAVYVQCSTASYVYQIDAASAPFLSLTLFDYQSKLVLLPDIDAVSEVEVQAPDAAVYSFRLEGEGEHLSVSYNGAALDAENFRRFYQTLTAARYESAIPAEEILPEDAFSQPSLRYIFRYRDGSPENAVTFAPGPPRKALVRLDEGQAYYAQSLYVDRVLADTAKIAAGEPLESAS